MKESEFGGENIKVVRYEHPGVAIPEYRCRYCGVAWRPRINIPKVCPNCHRRNWWEGYVARKKNVKRTSRK